MHCIQLIRRLSAPLVLPLLFFPSINFALTSSEVFPYALIFSALYFSSKEINLYATLLVGYLISSAIATSIICYGYGDDSDSIRSVSAYLNVIMVFYVILRASEDLVIKIKNLSQVVFVFLILLGLIQYTEIFEPFDSYIKLLVPRGSFGRDETRGVTLLSTEPARAGVELTMLYFFIRQYWSSKYVLFLDFIFWLFCLLVIKSAIVVALCLLGFILYNRKTSFVLITGVFVVIFFGAITTDIPINNRAIELLYGLMNSSHMIFDLVNQSGNRIASILAFYPFAITHPFGGGVGNWQSSSIDALNSIGFPYRSLNFFSISLNNYNIGMRGSGFLTNLSLDTGIAGIGLFIAYLISELNKFNSQNKINLNFMLLFVISIMLVGSVGTPVPWILLAVSLRYRPLINNSNVLNKAVFS